MKSRLQGKGKRTSCFFHICLERLHGLMAWEVDKTSGAAVSLRWFPRYEGRKEPYLLLYMSSFDGKMLCLSFCIFRSLPRWHWILDSLPKHGRLNPVALQRWKLLLGSLGGAALSEPQGLASVVGTNRRSCGFGVVKVAMLRW